MRSELFPNGVKSTPTSGSQTLKRGSRGQIIQLFTWTRGPRGFWAKQLPTRRPVPYFMGDMYCAPVPRLARPSAVRAGKGREAMCVRRKVPNRYRGTLDSRKAGAGAGQTMPLSLVLARLSPLATAVEMMPDLELTQLGSRRAGRRA